VGNMADIARRLMSAGKDPGTPAAVVEHAGATRQRTVAATLATLADAAQAEQIEPPAIIVVGQVTAMRQRLAWLEKLPLWGRTVIVTRAARQAAPLSSALTEFGAKVIEAPTIDIRPPQSFEDVDAALRRLGDFDWVTFTSPNGVSAFVHRCGRLGLDARALGGVKVAAVGSATAAALRKHFIAADLVPEQFTTEALGRTLVASGDMEGKRILLARADVATETLPDILRGGGAAVEDIAVYCTARPDALPQEAIRSLRDNQAEWVTFTSPLTVTNFLALIDKEKVDPGGIKLAAIGPVTAEALRRRGLTPTVVARPHTIDALVDAIVSNETKQQ